MQLSLPDIELFPVFTKIPVKIDVTFVAKGASSPTLPGSTYFSLQSTIQRDVRIKAYHKETTRTAESAASSTCAFGFLAQKRNDLVAVGTKIKETPWLPVYDDDKRPTGRWKQDVEIASSFEVTGPPSTNARALAVEVNKVIARLAGS